MAVRVHLKTLRRRSDESRRVEFSRALIAVSIVLGALCACAGGAWKGVLREDTPAAYHRFLREHPSSDHAPEARERLAFARVRNNPSLEAYDRFRADFPESPRIAELAPAVAGPSFRVARAAGTARAYREFSDRFPNVEQRVRAEGNAEFLENRGYDGDPSALADFAARHPESDFAAEAKRSAQSMGVRQATTVRRVALALDIAEGTPGADRLQRRFTEHARRRYQAAGIELFWAPGAADEATPAPPATLTIRHSERQVTTELGSERLSGPGILAETHVELRIAGHREPVWSDAFSYRGSLTEKRKGTSILFSPNAGDYWAQFFVPLATWKNQVAVRAPHELPKKPVAVETTGTRAIVLYGDGHFHLFALDDPAQLVSLAEYRRPRDLASFDGVRLIGRLVLLFGEDGLEIVELSSQGAKRIRAFERGTVGSITAAERVSGGTVVASNRGLLFLADDSNMPEKLVERAILGLARIDEDRLLFTDGKSFFVSTLGLLRAGRLESELRLGRGFGPTRVRALGKTALVLGERGMVRLDVTNPGRPRAVSQIMVDEVGLIDDATMIGGRVFLLGPRGVQVADPSGERIVDSVDVATRLRLAAAGRHLVMIGGQTLQVMDSTPFVVEAAAAPAAR